LIITLLYYNVFLTQSQDRQQAGR